MENRARKTLGKMLSIPWRQTKEGDEYKKIFNLRFKWEGYQEVTLVMSQKMIIVSKQNRDRQRQRIHPALLPLPKQAENVSPIF